MVRKILVEMRTSADDDHAMALKYIHIREFAENQIIIGDLLVEKIEEISMLHQQAGN